MRWSIKNENLVCPPPFPDGANLPSLTVLLPRLQLWRIIFQTQELTLELDKVSEAWRESTFIFASTFRFVVCSTARVAN